MSRRRIDPRAAREARRAAGGTRPRLTIEAAASHAGRLRRDPRAERAAQTVALGTRLRLDRSLPVAGTHPVSAPVAIAAERAAPRRVVVDDPAFLVLVVADAANGRLSSHDRQVLGAGRQLASGGGAVVLVGAVDSDEAGAAGADRLLVPAGPAWDPEGRTAELVALLERLAPRHILFPETETGGDLARRLAAASGEPLFPGADSVSAQAVGRPARGARVEQRCRPPRLVSIVPDVVAAHGGTVHEARAIEGASVAVERAILSAAVIPADPASVPLGEADFVLSAGNGVTDFDAFRALAAALKATPGASRMVCDAGLMPRAAQVGASGTVLGATCYFALGIAGAPQHLQGIARVEHVIAVNTDLHAAMIERAGLAVVADAQAVMPALLKALAAEEAP